MNDDKKLDLATQIDEILREIIDLKFCINFTSFLRKIGIKSAVNCP